MKRTTVSMIGFMMLVIVTSTFSESAFARLYDGSGTEGDPFAIDSAAEMNDIGNNLEDWDKHFILVNDINLANYTGTQFNVIGTDANAFSGVFDGNGHTISNFTYSSTDVTFVGLFGDAHVPGGQPAYVMIKDLGLIDPNVSSGFSYVGALAGSVGGGGIVSGCYVQGGSVSGDDNVGGLLGYVSGTVSNCFSSLSVQGNVGVGGLVGYNNGGLITNCYSSGSVQGNFIGGLVGGDSGGSYNKCFWDSDINSDVNGIGNVIDPNVIGKTTAQMQMESTFTDAGWDFVGETTNGPNDIWKISEGVDYPRFWWQEDECDGGNGEFSPIVNGSFEDDGTINNVIISEPNGWDVNIPAEFGGTVTSSVWETDGSYSFMVSSNGNGTFKPGDKAVLTQQVNLSSVHEITFDIKLVGQRFGQIDWDGTKFTAIVEIDGNSVWQSEPNANDVNSITIDVNSYTSCGLSTLTIGIRAGVDESVTPSYWTLWDNIKLWPSGTDCSGNGYLLADLDRSCYVDFNDVKVLGENWLRDDLVWPEDRIDIIWDGMINMEDFAAVAYDWGKCSDPKDENCFGVPLELKGDLNLDGVVNLIDYRILAGKWRQPGETIADIDGSNLVDFNDVYEMHLDCLDKNWRYGN